MEKLESALYTIDQTGAHLGVKRFRVKYVRKWVRFDKSAENSGKSSNEKINLMYRITAI